MNDYFIVDFHAVEFSATKVTTGLPFIDKHFKTLTNLFKIFFIRDLLLYFHDFLCPPLLYLCWDIVRKMISRSSFLMRVCKDANTIKSLLLQECFEFFNIIGCFAWKAGNQGSAQTNARNFFPDVDEQFFHFFFCDLPLHDCEHIVSRMLQRDVQILTNILSFTHDIQNLQRKFVRVRVVQPDPTQTLYVT